MSDDGENKVIKGKKKKKKKKKKIFEHIIKLLLFSLICNPGPGITMPP